MTIIPFSNLKLQQSILKDQLYPVLQDVIESGWYILGNRLKQFEKKFANYNGNIFCVGVASGTDAITLSLMALGIGYGDEVITTDITAYPTITAIENAGAVPVPVDIDPFTGIFDVLQIENAISPKTRAIVAVHLYGQCCDMEMLTALCRKHTLFLVEDCAQAAGSSFQGKKSGTYGQCGAFSFYPTKNLGAIGDGGAVVTDDECIYKRLVELRNYGQKNRYVHDSHGVNSRLDELQATVLDVKLEYLDKWNQRRGEIAAYYKNNLKSVIFLYNNSSGLNNYHLFVVKHPRRNALLEFLNNNGVQTLIHYPVPVHSQKAFTGRTTGNYTKSCEFADSILSLPMYPELTDVEVEKVVEIVNLFESGK